MLITDEPPSRVEFIDVELVGAKDGRVAVRDPAVDPHCRLQTPMSVCSQVRERGSITIRNRWEQTRKGIDGQGGFTPAERRSRRSSLRRLAPLSPTAGPSTGAGAVIL